MLDKPTARRALRRQTSSRVQAAGGRTGMDAIAEGFKMQDAADDVRKTITHHSTPVVLPFFLDDYAL